MSLFLCGVTPGPPWGYCDCGWPLFRDGSCSNGECPCPPYAWDEDEDGEEEL